jgi:large subunit ribosomal protein L23
MQISKTIATVYDVLINPVITEKSTNAQEQNKVVFVVHPDANKKQIRLAVQSIFGAKVKSVNIVSSVSKKKVFRGRSGVRSGTKKAIITVDAVTNFFSTIKG